ncbi:Sialoadhesin, partial [Dryobates pubescens]
PNIATSEEQTEGQTTTLECSTPYACLPADPTLRWEGYDPQVSRVSSRFQMDTSGAGHYLTLTTSFSWKDHSKKLLCEVSYGSKKATGEVTLRVRHAPKDTQVSVTPSTQNIRVGDTVSLSCEVSSSYPPISAYHWYKDGVAMSTEKVLTLRDVQREAYGQYHCEAQNPLGVGTAPAMTLYIFSAEMSVSPAAEVQEGTATTLSCDVPGRESQDLDYTWYKNSAWLKEGPAHTLLFQHVAATDAGYYSCKVTNDQGSDTSQPLLLSVTCECPRLLQGDGLQCPQQMRLPLSQGLHNALPESGKQLRGAAQGLGHHMQASTSPRALRLEIHSVGPQDAGEYLCTATNAHGSATATKLFTPRATEVLIQPSAEVQEGTAVTLTCLGDQAEAEDSLYTWYRNSRRLQESSSRALRFPSVRGEDAGAFQCQVQHRNSNSSHSSEPVPLRVLFPPRQPLLSSLLQTQGGRLGIIQCTTQSDPEASLSLWRGEAAIACTQGCLSAPNPRVHVTLSYNSLKVEIQEVVLEDEGTYVCWAGNSLGNASTALDFRA